MFIAKQKRRENIAEYILYLWQLEDMLRALELSGDAIYETLVAPHADLDEEQKQQLFFWYMDMVNLLVAEGKREQGHLEHTLHLINNELNDLHLHLLQAPIGKEKGYVALFAALAPELPKLKGSKPDMTDMEACFRALYSVMLCRLKPDGGKEAEQYIQDVMELVAPVVAKLAAIHGAGERGEVDLYKDMA